jgi:hypothetical protein
LATKKNQTKTSEKKQSDKMTARDEFCAELESTGRKGIKGLLKELDKTDFFKSPASTKYHGSYAGGLCDHSLMVMDAVLSLYDEYKKLVPTFPEIPVDSLKICALLHDVCKVETYRAGTRNVKNEQTGQWEKVPTFFREPKFPMGHGGKSVYMIAKMGVLLSEDEAQAIYWHMGAYDTSAYNTWNEMGQAYNENQLAFLLHQADMFSTYILENERLEK